jgi:ABC-2 type transport system permease protein
MILNIALKDLKVVFLRDKQNLITNLIMPLILILILGSALGSTFKSETSIEKFTVCVVNDDDGLMSKLFINKILRNNLSDMCETFVVNETTAKKMLKDKTVISVIYIPSNFSKDLEDNKNVEMTVDSQINKQFEAKIIESVVNGYSDYLSRNYASSFAVLDTIENNFEKEDFIVSQNGISKNLAVISDINENIKYKEIKYKENETDKTNDVSAIQYYSAAMLGMFILFSGINGSRFLVEEREKKTLERLKSAVFSKRTILFGKLLGLFLICLAQAIFMILFTWIIYKVSWGDSLIGIVIVTISTALAGASISLFVATISKSAKSADGIGTMIVWISTAFGGGMLPVDIMPKSLKIISNFTINNWIIKGYNSLMYGNSVNEILSYCLILGIMSIIYFGIGLLKFKI